MNKIRLFREKMKFTQSELAGKIGLSTKTLGRYERGEREPRMSDLVKISMILDCSLEDLPSSILNVPVARN